MSRVERLLNLTAALLTATRPLTRAEIRERVPGYPPGDDDRGSFRRAFERDKDALREMGIPLVLREVPGTDPVAEGYLIPRDQYALRDPGLEPDELAAIHLAAAAVQLDGLRGTEAIWKLGGVPAGADAADTLAALPTIPQLVPLFTAVSERRPVTFGYRGEQRTVDPHRLSFTRGRWYLDGEDHTRGASRQFRLDRVEGDVTLGEPGSFERPRSLDAGSSRPWEMGGEEPLDARVRVDADLAGWAVDHLGGDAVVAEDAHGVEVALRVTNRDAFRSFVLGFLDHAEVLGPPELRADMVAWLQELAGEGA